MSTKVSVERVFNFSAGPAVMPLPVLEQIRDEIVALPGVGSSVMEISHRGKEFIAILESTEQRLRSLMQIPSNYKVLFLQGGSRLQFSMVPMNLLKNSGKTAGYILTGSWGKKALEEAQREGATEVLWDGKSCNYNQVPKSIKIADPSKLAYVHYTSNETIEGVQFNTEPDVGDIPLVCDSSSEVMYKPIDVSKYGLIYACAQKNAGPAGLTVVIIREDLLPTGRDDLPGYLNYREHAENDSCYNTPPTFAIYVLNLICKWLQDDIGGIDAMYRINQEKAKLLYDVIDASSGFYQGHAEPDSRSLMNVTFRFASETIEADFLKQAAKHDLTALKGHRSVGGIRASIYNAMPVEGARALADFMKDFAAKNA
jgi:phosphoserine aminotransferase